jgi:lipid A ethanolaminephosphotransferase
MDGGCMPEPPSNARLAWTTTLEWPVLAASAYFVLFCNRPFWSGVLKGVAISSARDMAFLASLPLTLTSLFFMLLLMVSFRHTVKPLLAVLFIANAFALYFMDTYHVYLDRGMIRNVMQTDLREARELLSPAILAYVLLYGVLPVMVLRMVRLRPQPLARGLARRTVLFVVAGLVAASSVAGLFQEYLSFSRGHRELRHLLTPSNYVYAMYHNLGAGVANAAPAQRLTVGGDARLGTNWQAHRKPALFVMVVGEAARAGEFALNGYRRDTTPYLSHSGVFSFTDVSSCGTSTAESLPCMFSPFGRSGGDADTAREYESLLDVAQRAGFAVLWLDNNSGCKGVCAGVETVKVNQDAAGDLCPDGECYDEILLQKLDEALARHDQGSLFVVLHQHGSHGPSYSSRYPARFEQFVPVCRATELRDCRAAEVRNAYDNTILYTDYVLYRLVQQLRARTDQYDTAMVYVSDHGESLGEGGLYLHGLPYAMAPRTQTHVPLIFWMSPGFGEAFAVNRGCLTGVAGQAYSHDHLFHSVLGLLDIRTTAYDRSHDLFAPCQHHIV